MKRVKFLALLLIVTMAVPTMAANLRLRFTTTADTLVDDEPGLYDWVPVADSNAVGGGYWHQKANDDASAKQLYLTNFGSTTGKGEIIPSGIKISDLQSYVWRTRSPTSAGAPGIFMQWYTIASSDTRLANFSGWYQRRFETETIYADGGIGTVANNDGDWKIWNTATTSTGTDSVGPVVSSIHGSTPGSSASNGPTWEQVRTADFLGTGVGPFTGVPAGAALWSDFVGSSGTPVGYGPQSLGRLLLGVSSGGSFDVGHDLDYWHAIMTDGSIRSVAFTIAGLIDGDTEQDGDVDLADLSNLAANFGTLNDPTLVWYKGDFNGDLSVDLIDLSGLASNWGYGVAGSAPAGVGGSVPEPATLLLLGAGGLLLVGRRAKRS